jgi:hypothetical protein
MRILRNCLTQSREATKNAFGSSSVSETRPAAESVSPPLPSATGGNPQFLTTCLPSLPILLWGLLMARMTDWRGPSAVTSC